MNNMITNYLLIQQAPENLDEAYLFKIGVKTPKRFLIEERQKENKHEFVYIPNESHSLERKLEQSKWMEIDAFGNPRGFMFRFAYVQHWNNTDEYHFEIINKSPIKWEEPAELIRDKNSVNLILFDTNKSRNDKAQSLLTLLLDRQMCINDGDEDTYHFNSSYYAEFYDQVIDLIIKLDPIVFADNREQIVLPTLHSD